MSKTMLGAEYMHEAKNVSSVLGRESDVRVVFEGEGASTDGETIKLPSIDNNLQMDERLVKVSRGYVDHEAAHVKWTDQTQWKAAINRFKRSKENVWDKKCAMNALEDVRIERKLTALYAGSKRNIETLAHSIQMELHDSLAESGRSVEDLDAIEIGAVSVTWYGRQIGGYGQSCGEAFEKLDVELQDVVKAAVHKIDDNSTTKDMVSIAEDLVKEFARLAGRGGEDEEEEEEKGKGRKCDDGEDEEEEDSVPENSDEGDEGDDDGSDGDSDGDDSDGDSPDDISDGEDGEDGEEETTEAVEEAGNGRHQESPVSSKRPKKASVAINPDELKEKSVTKELSSESNCESGQVNYEYKRFSDRYDKVISRKELHVDLDMYGLMLEETAGQINVLRRTLERKLAAKMKRSWVGGQTNGRMDSRRLVGAYTGSEHVYKQREESEDIDTAVMILIDHSGSMSRRIIMAAKSCVALASALENTNISYAIQGFTTDENAIPKGKLPKQSDCSKYNSILPLVTIRYKEFGDKLSRVKGFLGGMKDTCHYYQEYNIDGISLEQSGRELLRRPEKRKVLMVLSDGKPANPFMSRSRGDNRGYDYKSHLESVVSSLMNDGIDVFGIGIESEAVRNYYPNYAVLDDLADLESEVIGKMDDLLIGGLNVRKAS